LLHDCTFLNQYYPVIQASGPLLWHCPLGKWSPTGGNIPIQASEDQDFRGCVYSCPIGSIGTSPDHSSAEDCSRCPEGQYCPSTGLTAGVNCSAGTHMPATGSSNEKSCIPCSPGQFNHQPGRAACNACPGGSYSEDVGFTRCTDCSAGGYCPEAEGGASSRLVYKYCPRGTWNNQRGSISNASCTSCPVGKASSREGANSASTCQLCRTGTVAPVDGMTECNFCSPGKYQDSEGATGCEQCDGGSYCQKGATAPLPCPRGTYSAETNLTSPSECTPADAGFFSLLGSTSEVPCSVGEFSSLARAPNCDRCVSGTFQDKPGQTACTACKPGFWCTAEQAVPCAEDTYQPLPHQFEQTSCTPCSRNSTTGSRQNCSSISLCGCLEGFYEHSMTQKWTTGQVDCHVCPSGSGVACTICMSCALISTLTRGCLSFRLPQCGDIC
jgi:hypothetical protein